MTARTLNEIASIIGSVENRSAREIWQRLRGRTIAPLLIRANDARRDAPILLEKKEIGAARFLMAAVEKGVTGAELIHLNHYARAEKQRNAKIINLETAIATPQSNWTYEMVRFHDRADGKMKTSGTWIENGFRFGSPDPMDETTVYGGPVEHIELIMFSNMWRPIAAQLALMDA